MFNDDDDSYRGFVTGLLPDIVTVTSRVEQVAIFGFLCLSL